MTNLNEILKAIQKQQNNMQNLTGLSSFNVLAEAMKKANLANSAMNLHGTADIARQIALQMKQYESISADFSSTLNFQLSSISSSLAQIAKQNKLVSDKFAEVVKSQVYAFNSLNEIVKNISQAHFNQFNALNLALEGISTKYLKQIAIAREWDDFDILEDANDTITEVAEKTIENETQISKDDIDEFRATIIKELSNVHSKCKSDRTRQFIIELIAIISFILTIHGTIKNSKDITNREAVLELKEEIEKQNLEFSDKIFQKLEKLNKTRIAKTNVNLRYSEKKRSKIIGLVKEGQEVSVIEIRHKYLLISYIDKDTKEPKSGFVVKKYFEKN